jgi:hypothetical protein
VKGTGDVTSVCERRTDRSRDLASDTRGEASEGCEGTGRGSERTGGVSTTVMRRECCGGLYYGIGRVGTVLSFSSFSDIHRFIHSY